MNQKFDKIHRSFFVDSRSRREESAGDDQRMAKHGIIFRFLDHSC